MKLKIDLILLKNAFAQVGPVMKSSPVIPIIENVLIAFINNDIVVVGTNISSTVFSVIKADDFSVEGEVTNFLMPYKECNAFFALLNGATESIISLEDKQEQVVITRLDQKGSYKLNSEDVSDYPVGKFSVDESFDFKILGSDLFNVLKSTVVFCDATSLNSGYQSIAFKQKEDSFMLYATDGYRAVEKSVQCIEGKMFDFSLHKDSVSALLSLIDKDVEVRVKSIGDHVLFLFDNKFIKVTLSEETPPIEGIESMLSNISGKEKLVIDRDALITSINRAAPYLNSEKKDLILKIKANKMKVLAMHEEYGKSCDLDMICDSSITGAVVVNSRFLKEVVNANTSEQIEILLEIDSSIGFCKTALILKEDKSRILLMPHQPGEYLGIIKDVAL